MRAKKSLGQNFLIDKNIQNKIISSCEINQLDTVLEIGSGTGAITGLISKKADKVYALEVDRQLIPRLLEKFSSSVNVEIILADILKFDIASCVRDKGKKIKIIGNIPYYITTPIIEQMIKYKEYISSAYLMVQKEFAERVIASVGSKRYGSLTCFVQYHFTPKVLFVTSRNSFSPRPKVDSCFLQLMMRNTPAVAVKDEERFFKVVHAAFGQRRKTLRNSLKEVVSIKNLDEFFLTFNIDRNIRPEWVSLQNFADLAGME
jgi:16S rRNA (adenine1518-N6/adenine1519-N6)-dimethyltransferase